MDFYKKIIRDKRLRFKILKALKFVPDKQMLKIQYFIKTKRRLNLKNPKTFGEKIQWLKLYDSTPIKTRLADKYLVRDWIKEKIGEEYLIPLLGVWEKADDIEWENLPNRFVLKCNHGCAYNIICTNKENLNKEKSINKN